MELIPRDTELLILDEFANIFVYISIKILYFFIKIKNILNIVFALYISYLLIFIYNTWSHCQSLTSFNKIE